MMEIMIRMSEEGRFEIDKTEGMPIFTAIGMLELGKKILLDPNQQRAEEEVEDVIEDETDEEPMQ